MAYDTHFLIPFASSTDPACLSVIKTLALPNLTRFLQQAEVMHTDSGDEFDFIPPHERALNGSNHLGKLGANGVIVTPCHWSVGIDNIRMENPDDLHITDSESRELFRAVQPYFQEDGITLTYDSPLRWLATSQVLQGLALASLDRVIGRNVDVWQPQNAASKSIRRLQNEMQMLLYTHPINEVREARGLPTVNSFWLNRAVKNEAKFDVECDFSLRESALRGDWQTWSHVWATLDQKLSKATRITLCGERHSIKFAASSSRTFLQKARGFFQAKPTVQSVLESL
jgi:hypothetical protein